MYMYICVHVHSIGIVECHEYTCTNNVHVLCSFEIASTVHVCVDVHVCKYMYVQVLTEHM